ncbi:MAG: hypothetical protein MUC92_00535 [Fimbriimonadaceae bacterium]|jgi:hypothetical protein|nr:hypothetical protein [Fimbriimonadaceae bacterium]
MKLVLWLVAGCLAVFGVTSQARQPQAYQVIITGDTFGYLSPCGCVKPMTGGVRRRISAIKSLKGEGEALVLDIGALVKGTKRQDEMKAETLAEIMRLAQVDLINLTSLETQMGDGVVGALQRLSGEALTSSLLPADNQWGVRQSVAKGPFLVGAIDEQLLGRPNLNRDESLRSLLQEAREADLVPLLVTNSPLATAREIAKRFPEFRLITYRDSSNPSDQWIKEGDSVLISPGERGKFVLSLGWNGKTFDRFAALSLGPEFPDDPDSSRIYRTYLGRVTDEKLLDLLPRNPTADFIGTKACAPCHGKAYEVWVRSEHASALKTLEEEFHDRDPDCTSCHVVGLESTKGFRDRKITPHLADVGCESCHGPGKAHAMNPVKVKMDRLGEASCLKCHNQEHSPTFEWKTYWEKIAH